MRRAAWGAGLVALLAVLPFLVDHAWLSVLTLILFFAFVGQAWNLAMGYAGQLSLGHALFVGIGAYTTSLLLARYGVTPWIGLPTGALLAALAAAAIGWLAFRFAVRGVYFALLTIAFAEFARIGFDNWEFVGGSGGFFLAAVTERTSSLFELRGGPVFFYYAFLLLAVAAFLLIRLLVASRLGYFWRAIREDEEAARALGIEVLPLKMLVVALSAALTAVGGGMYGLYNGSVFPDTVMGMRMSIDIIVAPIVGGLGTLFGPVLGAFVVISLLELARELAARAGVLGLNILIYGILLLLVVMFAPDGIWPRLARPLGLGERQS